MSEIVPVVLEVRDIIQQYKMSIVLYKGTPVLVTNVHDDRQVTYKDFQTGKKVRVPFNMEDFTPPDARLGLVNIKDSVVLLERIPARVMVVGIKNDNIKVHGVASSYPFGKDATMLSVYALDCVEVFNTLVGKYPTYEEALEMLAGKDSAAVAFDRQFFIDKEFRLFYKTTHVADVYREKGEYKQHWRPRKEHVKYILERGYEKGIRIPCLA